MSSPRVITPCAKIRGSRPYNVGGKVFSATRGSRTQVMNGTAHHSCGGLKKGDYTRNPKTGRIVSKKRRQSAMKNYAKLMKNPEAKAKWMSNMGQLAHLR